MFGNQCYSCDAKERLIESLRAENDRLREDLRLIEIADVWIEEFFSDDGCPLWWCERTDRGYRTLREALDAAREDDEP